MDEFLILLQAKLDEAKSIENLNGTSGDIAALQGKLNTLQLQATLDPNTAQKLADDIGKLINQKITISNIGIDANSGVKAGQEYGKQFTQGVSQKIKDNISILNKFKESLTNIGMGSEEIDIVANRIKNLVLNIESLNQTHTVGKNSDMLFVNVSGIDEYGQAIKLTQQYNFATGELIKTIDNVSTIQLKAGASVNNFAKQQSQAVNSLLNQINQINRAANDQNASRPITDSSHLNTLSNAYNDIISGIERMKNVSSDTFVEEQNNVKTLISNYKSLVSEFRNAENVATQMKSVDISSGIAQAQERLGKLKANASGFEQMTQTIRELDVAIEGVGDKSSLDNFLNQLKVAESQLGRVKAETKAITQDNKIQLKAQTLKSKLEEFSQKNYGFSTWKKDINGVTISFESLISSLNMVKSIDDLKIITDQANALKSSFLAVKANADAVRTEISDLNKSVQQANKIQLSIETGGYESKVDSLIVRTRQWTDANGNARISTDNLSSAFDKLLSASNAFSNNKTIANQQALIKAENELNIEIEKVTNSVRKRNAEFAKDATISSLHNQIQKFYDNNGAAHRKWGAQLKQMLSETASGAELTKERVTEIKTAFNGVASAAQQAGKVGKTWFQSFKDAAKFLTYWTSPTFITMKTIAEIKQGINTVKELDTALVDLKKTTTMTGSELENFYYDSNKVAK